MTILLKVHEAPPISLLALIRSMQKNWQLVVQMVKREVVGRYKGSFFGLAWSFFNPILMLTIYTFVFSVVFKAKWGMNSDEGKAQFALTLFVGLIIFNLFSEAINRAPNLILGNVNYVKKVVFPLEILPVISIGTSLFHALISLFVLMVAITIFNGHLNWTTILIPLIFIPLVFLIMGLSWILASLGVYMRDVGQTIGILTSVLMFLSPVFYSIDALPPRFQFWLMLNPLSFIIEQARAVLIQGQMPSWDLLGIYTLGALIFMWCGYVWFQKTRKGFADVL
jgi:lipopolysaccharide transport system permease protein